MEKEDISANASRFLIMLVLIAGVISLGSGVFYLLTAQQTSYSLVVTENQSAPPTEESVIHYSDLPVEVQDDVHDAINYGSEVIDSENIESLDERGYVKYENRYYRYHVSKFSERSPRRLLIGFGLSIVGGIMFLVTLRWL
jgi:hypothetical protein